MSPGRALVTVLVPTLVMGCSAAQPSMAQVPPASSWNAPGTPVVEVALTVDDLPAHGPLPPGVDRIGVARALLGAFARHRLPRVYGFVNGKRLDDDAANLSVLTAWLNAGYPLGNHTYAHTSLNASSLADYFADLERGEAVLKRLEPEPALWKFFRYPYLFEGDTLEKRNAVRAYLREHRYVIAEVTIDADDWAYNPPFARCAQQGDAARLAALRSAYVQGHVEELRLMRALGRQLAQREVKQVLLLHAGAADADAMEELLSAYEREGVRWVELPTALADPLFSVDPALPSKAGAAFLYRLAQASNLKAPSPVYARDLEDRLDALCR